jgi:hypothetical protein
MKSLIGGVFGSTASKGVGRRSTAGRSSGEISGTADSMDEKRFSAIVELLEVLVKKSSFDSVIGDVADTTGREVDSVYNSIINGMASKRFLESSNSAILWPSLIRVLNSTSPIFSNFQCNDLRDASEVRM